MITAVDIWKNDERNMDVTIGLMISVKTAAQHFLLKVSKIGLSETRVKKILVELFLKVCFKGTKTLQKFKKNSIEK